MNAGATHPRSEWLNALRLGGRLMLPLTATADSLEHGSGGMLKVTRARHGYSAQFISEVAIFPCTGARDPELNAPLAEAFKGDSLKKVKSLRTAPHRPDVTCWLHARDFCLSTSNP